MEEQQTEYQAFFLDFDGVLVDSVEIKTRAFARLFEIYGTEVVERVVDHHRNHGGMTRIEKFHHYYRNFLKKELPDAELAELCSRFSSIVVEEIVAAPEIPGAESFLKKYSGRIPVFVISATPDVEISRIVELRGWSGYFREVCGSSLPKKDQISRLLGEYELNARSCIFFGDAEVDYNAARACCVPFVGIVSGPDHLLLKVDPDIKWLSSFNEKEHLNL